MANPFIPFNHHDIFSDNDIGDFRMEDGGYNLSGLFDLRNKQWIEVSTDELEGNHINILPGDPMNLKKEKYQLQFQYILSKR